MSSEALYKREAGWLLFDLPGFNAWHVVSQNHNPNQNPWCRGRESWSRLDEQYIVDEHVIAGPFDDIPDKMSGDIICSTCKRLWLDVDE